MGVRGLTSFIARHAELYLKPYELHDCPLVIDGDNLACNLYKDVSGKNSAFGGDYDSFYRSVVEFFHVIDQCNIRAYVLMDGGYEKKKLRTVWQRLRGKISMIKRIDPLNSHNIFPLMMREVFIDAARDCGIPVMRCVFEADEELAALSRVLNCPVLSYDSDFYIHNVQYIPSVTLTIRAHTKKVKGNRPGKEKLSKCEVRHLEKRTKGHQIFKDIKVDLDECQDTKTTKTYKYMDCCIYKIENLFQKGALSKEKLPLFAAMLGNDYIPRSAFRSFFAQMKQKGMTKKTTRQHKRIRKVIQWLKHETLDSALDRILATLKKPQRDRLMAQMKGAVEGYCNESCFSYQYFDSAHEIDERDEIEEDLEHEDVEEVEEEEIELNTEEEGEEKEETEPNDEEEEIYSNEKEEEIKSNESEKEDKEVKEEKEKEKEKSEDDSITCPVAENISNDEESEESSDSEDENDDEEENLDPSSFLPEWLKNRLYSAELSRFLVDLAYLRLYINNPQVEHFPFPDCNQIALPILKFIFSLLNNIKGDEEDKIYKEKPIISENATLEGAEELVPYFRYLTRLPRVSNIHTVRYHLGSPPKLAFNPHSPDPQLLQEVFHDLKLDSKELFENIKQIPADLKLYFLSIVYWIQKTPNADLLHLRSLLICLVVLRTIDSKLEPIRDIRAFQKRFGNTIKKEKAIRTKQIEEGIVKPIRPQEKDLSPPDKIKFISKLDCLLVQDNLLKHFHMQEVFKKKYDSFSSTVLHGFSEFQSVVFNLNGLNALLASPYERSKMAQSYCGVFLYNIYDLLRSRIDIDYFIQNHIFHFSPMMFEFYNFLWNWCQQFTPHWQKNKLSTMVASKNVLKKRKAAAKKKANATKAKEVVDPNDKMLESDSEPGEETEFYDLNNKFCTLLKIS